MRNKSGTQKRVGEDKEIQEEKEEVAGGNTWNRVRGNKVESGWMQTVCGGRDFPPSQLLKDSCFSQLWVKVLQALKPFPTLDGPVSTDKDPMEKCSISPLLGPHTHAALFMTQGLWLKTPK